MKDEPKVEEVDLRTLPERRMQFGECRAYMAEFEYNGAEVTKIDWTCGMALICTTDVHTIVKDRARFQTIHDEYHRQRTPPAPQPSPELPSVS